MKNFKITDIAKIAGVSIKTVSRVINNSPEVKEKTKKKVMDVINKFGYSANIFARGLKSNKIGIIIIFFDDHGGNFWNAWHHIILSLIMKELKKNGYKVVVSSSSAKNFVHDNTDGFYLLKSGLSDGAILFDTIWADRRVEYLHNNLVPFVIIGRDVTFFDTSYIDINNYNVGVIGAEYLIQKKYKRTLLLVGNEDFIVNQHRIKGFMETSKKYGFNDNFYISGVDNPNIAYEKTKMVISEKKVDSVFVSGDERATGVYKAIVETGLKIPHDIAVLGIDNLPLCEYMSPSLSSINQPRLELAGKTVELLLERLNNPKNKFRRIILEPELVIRQST